MFVFSLSVGLLRMEGFGEAFQISRAHADAPTVGAIEIRDEKERYRQRDG